MPEPTRDYLFTERQIRLMFGGVTVLLVLALLAVLVLISARPQGVYSRADTRQFDATVAAAAESFTGYRELENGRVQLDIDRAIELVAERGVNDAFTALADDDPDAVGAGEADGALQLPDGGRVYGSCAGCHQANGQGVPGVFPPLAGHAADLYAADPEYLAEVVIFGLQGPITVDGEPYGGVMPAWDHLSDAEIAAVLNHILGNWGNEEEVGEEQPYDDQEIALLRARELSPADVHTRREQLELP